MTNRPEQERHTDKYQDRKAWGSGFEHWLTTLMLVIYDILAVNAAFFLALWFRFDCRFSAIPEEYWLPFLRFAPFYTLFCLLVFWLLRLYQSIWRFASFRELEHVILSSAVTGLFQIVAITVFLKRMPISYYMFGIIIQFLLISAARFGYRFLLLLSEWRSRRGGGGSRVMLIGAGSAGQMILRDMLGNKESSEQVCCIIDDNPNKWNRYIEGVPIVGGRDDILVNCEKYKIEKIYLALPSATAEEKRDILDICKETGCEMKILPGIYQSMTENVTAGAMKEVSIEDLLGRDPIQADMTEVFRFLRGKTILVTGGGGSIGSELCRQIASHEPRRLIIFDIYENNAYDIQMELRDKYPELDLVTIIGSVRDSRRLEQVFADYRPDVVYHAAAHKHVPLMEDSPCEAIKNNTIGTYKTAYAAMRHGCRRFVLISTDKAVNPTNVMGASKRLCEMVIQTFNQKIRAGSARELPRLSSHVQSVGPGEAVQTEFVAVRFGNVLGSNGSVVPLFKRQIARGGPVTVTHPDIIRYFMTVPEAVGLVLQAGTFAQSGEIFVLDMGNPVKIDTLARNLIKLSGFKPDEDIKIAYTGLRPGEKLYEEKLMAEEGLRKTSNKLIHIGSPIPFDTDRFLRQLEDLARAAYANDPDIRRLVMAMVDTYHPGTGEDPLPVPTAAQTQAVPARG